MELGIINKSDFPLPKYATKGSSGMDLYCNEKGVHVLNPLDRKVISTGIYLRIPKGFEVQIRSKSGNASKYGIIVLNEPATIDSDYTGEIKVILCNLSNSTVTINHGDGIAQMVLAKVETAELIELKEVINNTDRGNKGFGSTGNNINN